MNGQVKEDPVESSRVQSLRRRPLGRYRYVRLRWRVLFAVIDFVGAAVFGAVQTVQKSLLRRTTIPPGQEDDPKLILLVQLDHMGDAIISTAILPALRARYPQASIEVLAGPCGREVFEASPEVDHVHVSRVNRFVRGSARLLSRTKSARNRFLLRKNVAYVLIRCLIRTLPRL